MKFDLPNHRTLEIRRVENVIVLALDVDFVDLVDGPRDEYGKRFHVRLDASLSPDQAKRVAEELAR